ncbi:uncharacterized protein JCM10292_007386 [Rhodotorula paludigena]|uniref:uncharacterized protein n=1 Tax=Rhodotorula paludigena TaxID=86838 RepID=UPI00316C7D54
MAKGKRTQPAQPELAAAAATPAAPPPAPAGGRQSILPLFPLLSSHNAATRLDAAAQLVQVLPLAATAPSDPDTPYALKRLIAGLASSNEAARQGFAVALAQLVSLLPADSDLAARVLPQLIDATTPKAGTDAREERDLLFARLMGLHALVRAGVLVRSEGKTAADGENWKEVVQALVTLANKKTWIREPAYWVVCEALGALLEAPEQLSWKDEVVRWAVQRLVGDAREKARGFTPEKVAVVLVLQAHGVDADWTSLLAPTFPSGSLLSRSSLSALATALRGASSAAADGPSSGPKQGSNAVKTAKGAAAPAPGQAPHFVWNLLADAFFSPSASSSNVVDRVPFTAFWSACIDNSLFASSSLPLKALGFSLIQLFLPLVPASDVPALLSPHAIHVLANHLRRETSGSGGEKTLSRVADKLVSSVLPAFFASSDAGRAAALPVLKKLVSPPESQHNAFEPKVLERLVVKLPLAGTRGWVAHLRSVVLAPALAEAQDDAAMEGEGEGGDDAQTRDKAVAAQRNWALDQLLFVVRNASVEKDDDLVKGLLEFLAVVGWFDVKKEASKGARSYVAATPLAPSHRQSARTRFFSILASLLTAPAPLGGAAWLARALALLDNLAADTKHFSRAADDEEDDDEEDEVEGKALDTRLQALHAALVPGKKDDESLARVKAAARALVEGVRLVAWDEGADEASDVLEGAVDAVEALVPALKGDGAGADDDDEEDDEDEKPEPTTVVMDVLLALLRRPSAFVKAFTGPIVLKGLAEEVGLQAVELLRDIVAPEDEAPEDEDEEQEDGAEGAADAKKGKKQDKAKAPAAEDDSEDDDDEDADSSDDEDVEIDEAFKNELLAALEAGGMGVPGADGSDDDEDEEMEGGDESEEELLDDDAMLALDERLADIFRANGGGRKSKKRDRQDDLHYRLRCLDLFDVLAHTKASSALLIPLYVPLFNLIRTASSAVESELQTKASKLLRFLVQPRKTADAAALVEPSDESSHAALEALEDLFRAAASTDDASLAPLCAQVAVALTKAAIALSPAASLAHAQEHIAELAAVSFEKYLTTKNAKTRVQPALTVELAKRAPAAVWGMLARVVELAGGDGKGEKVNAFRRMQAFELAQTLFTSFANLKTAESKTAVLAEIPSYRSALYSAISTSLTSATPEFDAARLKTLTKQALSSARQTVQLSSQADAAKLWRPVEWAALVSQAQGSERFKGAVGVHTLLKQLVGVFGGSVEEAAKPAGGKKDKKRKAGAQAAQAAETQGTPAKKAKSAASPAGKSASASKGKKQPPAPAVNPESEVQDESVEAADDGVQGGDVSMALTDDGATPSKKQRSAAGGSAKKEKKRRRESAAGKA